MENQAGAIVIALHDLPLGGSERIAVRLANRWAALGRRVTLFCGTTEGPLAAMIDARVEVVQADPPIPRGKGSRRRLGRALAEWIAHRRPDVLFVPGNYHWPVLPEIDRLPEAVRPAVIAQIGTPLYRHGRNALAQIPYNLRTRRQLRRVDRAISLSPSMTRDADRVLWPSMTRCIRLPALDDDDQPFAPVEGKTILAAGRLVEEKGFDVALRAFARLADPEARLVIVGEGPCRPALELLARDLGVADRVSLPGYVPDIRPWLEAARVFLLSSYYEGYAAVIVEALGAGRPVVATDCSPAAQELLVAGLGGEVAAIGDAQGLADGLRRVLDQPARDPAWLADSVARYRLGPIAQAYLAEFDAAVAARAVPGVVSISRAVRASAWPGADPATASPATPGSAWRRSA